MRRRHQVPPSLIQIEQVLAGLAICERYTLTKDRLTHNYFLL